MDALLQFNGRMDAAKTPERRGWWERLNLELIIGWKCPGIMNRSGWPPLPSKRGRLLESSTKHLDQNDSRDASFEAGGGVKCLEVETLGPQGSTMKAFAWGWKMYESMTKSD